MIRFLLFLALISGISSCSTYYVGTVQSQHIDKDERSGVFIHDNDSVQITYNFFGQNAPVSIEILNKLDEPLYIDWQRSALIIDEHATSYMGNDVAISGRSISSGSTLQFSDTDFSATSSSGRFNATATLPRNISFVPPKARVEKTQLEINNMFFQDIPDSSYKSRQLAKLDGTISPIKVSTFSETTSPLAFTSYLTLYTLEEATDRPKRMVYEQDFYVSEVVKMRANPKNLLSFQAKRGDSFYFQQVKGKTAALIGASAVLIGTAAALDASDNNRNNNYRRK